jgi:hypothetical protein
MARVCPCPCAHVPVVGETGILCDKCHEYLAPCTTTIFGSVTLRITAGSTLFSCYQKSLHDLDQRSREFKAQHSTVLEDMHKTVVEKERIIHEKEELIREHRDVVLDFQVERERMMEHCRVECDRIRAETHKENQNKILISNTMMRKKILIKDRKRRSTNKTLRETIKALTQKMKESKKKVDSLEDDLLNETSKNAKANALILAIKEKYLQNARKVAELQNCGRNMAVQYARLVCTVRNSNEENAKKVIEYEATLKQHNLFNEKIVVIIHKKNIKLISEMNVVEVPATNLDNVD